MRYLPSTTIKIHIFTFVWELPCSLRSWVCQANCIGKDVARSYFKIFYCIWPQPIKLCICYQQLISYFTNYLWLLDAEYNFLEIKIGQKCGFQDTCSPVKCIIAKSILFPIGPDEYLKHEFKLKIMPGKFNWPLTIYTLYLRLLLLGKSWWIIILTYLNCPYILLPMHMCISHATRHTDKHIPPCILVATRNFKGPYVHSFIHHSISNLYLCRCGHRKKKTINDETCKTQQERQAGETSVVIPTLSNAHKHDWREVKYFTVREQRKAQFISISCVLGQWQFNTIPVGV